jgi:hypothetical protein
MQCSKQQFYHLICAHEERWWQFEAERFGGDMASRLFRLNAG